MENQPNQQMNIELTEDVAGGVYSNFAIISHSNTEFVMDFVQVLPGLPKAKVRSRIILSPQHAKRLQKALNDNIKKYETQQGEIAEDNEFNIPMHFGGPQGQA